MRKLIGKVTEEEKREIQSHFERRNGLAELAKVITADNEQLYERLVADMGTTTSRSQAWWDAMSRKYGWESADNGHWEIDFPTNDIYLNC